MCIKKIPTGIIIIIISIILTMLLMLEVTAGNVGVGSIEKGICQDLDTNTSRVIIGFKDSSLDKQQIDQYQDNLINKYGGKRIINKIDKLNCIIIELEERTEKQEFIRQIIANEHRNIKYVEPDHIVTITHTPNDLLYPYQWGPQAIQSEHAWDTQRGNSSLTIAIIDTGIDYTHEDLENYISGGYDWVNDDNDPMDDHGHGTHCAGIATAKIDNNKGVAGIAQVSVMGLKVLGASGSGWTSDVAAGIINATDQGADIISLSLGSTSFSSTMQDACQYAWDAGCVIIAASGNNNKSIIYPAKYDTVIAVGAINSNNERCNNTDWGTGRGSNYGPELELIAPGDNILSTVPGFVNLTGYESWRGTSMAAPHVTGVAALVWSNCPGFTNSEIREQLIYTADDLGDKGWDQYYGWGRVDAEKAINCSAASCIEIEPGYFDPEILENCTRDNILTLENTGTKIGLFETYVVPDEIYFTDYMESGINGWTHGGDMDEWELGNPVYGPFNAHSGVNCWGTDLDNTYEYTADAWLVSPVIDLGGVDQANLSFWQWHELLNDDACYIEISIDNGSNWIELKKYSDNEITWSKEDINITAYTGSDETRIRFRLESDWFDNRAGLYIDDIQIYRPCDWLFEDTILGIVYPQKSENITITCDVAGLDTGTYNGSVVVSYESQDSVKIQVNLNVLPGGNLTSGLIFYRTILW